MKILNLNMKVSDAQHSRADRMSPVAQLVKEEGVDVLLLQEGVRSCLVYDSIRSLNKLLGGWNIYERSYVGVPFFWEFRVGILSRFPIVKTSSVYLEVPQDLLLDAVPLPGRRRAILARVQHPDFGEVEFVSVHLTAGPKTEQYRENQFIRLMNWLAPNWRPVILGGDFNAGRGSSAYQVIESAYFKEIPTGSSPDFIFTPGRVAPGNRQARVRWSLCQRPLRGASGDITARPPRAKGGKRCAVGDGIPAPCGRWSGYGKGEVIVRGLGRTPGPRFERR